MFTRLYIVICAKLQHLSCLKSILGLCGTAVPHFQPMYAFSLFVYLDLAQNLSHTLNIFIFSCNFPGTFPNLTRERSIPLFRLRLPAFQISCLLLWLQRDANILVQALRSIQHTTYRSVFNFAVPLALVPSPITLYHVSTQSPYHFCLSVSQKLSLCSMQ